jgi:site-specific recombinase XerD
MNSFDISFLCDEAQFKTLLREHILDRTSLRTSKSQRECRFFIGNFRRWWITQGEPNLTEEILLAWMLDGLQRANVKTIAAKVIALNKFFDFLADRNLLTVNPLRELRRGYRSRGYRGILRDLQRTGSVGAVIALADHPFSGPLGQFCLDYLDYLAALGKKCANHRYRLISFERFLRQHNISSWSQVDSAFIEEWLRIRQRSAYQQRCILLVLQDFFWFLINRNEVAESPVPSPGPHSRRSLPPRIFSIEEVQMILDETAKLPDTRLMPFRGQTYRMLFLTLYTLGLRSNEALNLRLGDIDFIQHCLTIGQTKFYKGRVLPFGPRYETALRSYIDAHTLLRDGNQDTFLFPTDSHRTPHLASDSAFRTLRRIVNQLGLTTPPETRQPGLHSFRHAFSVHWMERWLREGDDVQVKLPLLSSFLGHVDTAATQVYLTMTPERLGLIGERFEEASGSAVDQ